MTDFHALNGFFEDRPQKDSRFVIGQHSHNINPKENSDNFLDNLDLNSDELTSDQAYKLRQTISEYSNIFSSRYSGATDLVTHRKDVGYNRPINAAPYRVSPNERRVIDSEWSNACSKTTHH